MPVFFCFTDIQYTVRQNKKGTIMLNRAQFEGKIVKVWSFKQGTYVRVVHNPDPGQGTEDMLMTVKFPPAMPRSAFRVGDTIRSIGYVYNRKTSPEGAEKATYVCEIHAEKIVRIASRVNREETAPAVQATEPAALPAAA